MSFQAHVEQSAETDVLLAPPSERGVDGKVAKGTLISDSVLVEDDSKEQEAAGRRRGHDRGHRDLQRGRGHQRRRRGWRHYHSW